MLTERAVQGVKEAIKTAEDCDVVYCVEVVNRFEHFMLNTAAEGISFAKRVGSPNCKLLLDTFHMNIEEDSLRGAILESKGWLGHFHLGETNRRPPARVEFRGRKFLAPCGRSITKGAVTMEPFLLPGGEVGRDVSLYRDLLGDADRDELATRSLRFVRSEQSKKYVILRISR